MILENVFWIFFKNDFETRKNVKNNARNKKINHFSYLSDQDFLRDISLLP